MKNKLYIDNNRFYEVSEWFRYNSKIISDNMKKISKIDDREQLQKNCIKDPLFSESENRIKLRKIWRRYTIGCIINNIIELCYHEKIIFKWKKLSYRIKTYSSMGDDDNSQMSNTEENNKNITTLSLTNKNIFDLFPEENINNNYNNTVTKCDVSANRLSQTNISEETDSSIMSLIGIPRVMHNHKLCTLIHDYIRHSFTVELRKVHELFITKRYEEVKALRDKWYSIATTYLFNSTICHYNSYIYKLKMWQKFYKLVYNNQYKIDHFERLSADFKVERKKERMKQHKIWNSFLNHVIKRRLIDKAKRECIVECNKKTEKASLICGGTIVQNIVLNDLFRISTSMFENLTLPMYSPGIFKNINIFCKNYIDECLSESLQLLSSKLITEATKISMLFIRSRSILSEARYHELQTSRKNSKEGLTKCEVLNEKEDKWKLTDSPFQECTGRNLNFFKYETEDVWSDESF